MSSNKPVIITLRGTYGSGKTTLARFIMDTHVNEEKHYQKGRTRPLYHTFDHPNGGNPLAVVGSYETVCGGCDTIGDNATIFETVDYLQSEGYNVLYESIMLTGNIGHTVRWFQTGWNLQVVYLDVPVPMALASVNQRRREKDPDAVDVNPKNLLGKAASCRSSYVTLQTHHVPVHLLDRAAAYTKCLELLEVDSVL